MNVQNLTPTYRAYYDRTVARTWVTQTSPGLSPATLTMLRTVSLTFQYIYVIESVYIRIRRATVATTVGETAAYVQLSNSPSVLNVIGSVDGKLATVGDSLVYVGYPHIFTYGDDLIYISYSDSSTGGTIDVDCAVLYETLFKN